MKECEKTGQFKNYDREGHLLLEGFFSNGRLAGENKAYFTDGTLRHKFQYMNGAKVGANLIYHPNGKLRTKEVVSTNGIDIAEEGFRDDGTRAYEKYFRKLMAHDVWIYYDTDGRSVLSKETYLNGKLHGPRTVYYANGEKQLEEVYQFNLITGLVKNYYENGKISSEEEYRASRSHGLFTAYYPGGKIKEQGEYVAGKKHKVWNEYDEKGNITRTYIFQAGILVEDK